MRTVALLGSNCLELSSARRARSPAAHVAAAMRLKRRCAIRADDLEVLEAIGVTDSIDVIEDQRDALSAPELVLTAQLAATRLEAFCVEALLELSAREGRPSDEDLAQRPRGVSTSFECLAARGVRVEVVDRDPPDLDRVRLQRAPVAPTRTHAEPPQRFRERPRCRDGFARLSLGIPRSRSHEHMFAEVSDGSGTGGPGLEPGLPEPKSGVLPTTPPPKRSRGRPPADTTMRACLNPPS